MSGPHPSRSVHLARSWMRLALRFWPAESREWGHALAAELDSIHDPVQAIRWTLGGTLLFARALFSHCFAWFRLPVGARLNGGVHPSVQLPHHSRLFSAALLVVTAAILCLPQGRQALSAVKMSWGFSNVNIEVSGLERIGRQADHENDARTLAFAGLALLDYGICSPSRNRLATDYAERAVAIDPSLAWIYSDGRLAFGLREHQSEWLARLKAADPENAFPYLLTADAILEERYAALIHGHSPTDLDIQVSVENNAYWVGAVERGIRARRFDTYSKNYFDLFKAFYRQNPSLEPSTYLRALRGRRVPGDFSLSVYVSILIRRAEEARSVESFTTATRELKRVVQFDEQVSERAEDGWYGRFDQTTEKALIGVKAALLHRGYREEAATVEGHLQRFEQQRNHRNTICRARSGYGRLRRTAVMVHSLGFALVLFGSLLVVSVVILEIPVPGQWRLRRYVRRPACLIADLCPALLVLTGVAFLSAYQPFVRTFKTQLSQSASLFDLEAIWTTYGSLDFLPSMLLPYVGWVFVPWAFACFLLALLALFILVRGFFRTRPAKPPNKLGHKPSVT